MESQTSISMGIRLNPLKIRKSFRHKDKFVYTKSGISLNPLKTRKSFRQYHLQTLIIQGITRPFFRMSQKFSKILAFFYDTNLFIFHLNLYNTTSYILVGTPGFLNRFNIRPIPFLLVNVKELLKVYHGFSKFQTYKILYLSL